ncbi:MAG: VIT domain-containing protein [Planctomycetota bacterium]
MSSCLGLAALAAVQPAFAQQAQPTPSSAALQQLAGAAHVIVPQTRSFALAVTDPSQPASIQIESVEARIQVLEQASTTTLQIALRNHASRPQEAVLLVPVPDGAVVSAFTFEGTASEPTAQVLAAGEARRLYEAIVAKVRDPALLEFAGFNLIRSSVFPVPPQGSQTVRLTYEHLLDGDGNRVDYLLPRSESLDRRRPWRIQVDLKSRHPISMVYSPSHEVSSTRLARGHFSVELTDEATLEPGPFRLSYLLEREGVSASLFAYPDPGVGGGYFLLMGGLPSGIDEAATRIKREVTLVIDRSGSMAGPPMDQVRAAALQIIEGLSDGEAFNIVDYASTVSLFAPRPVLKDPQTTRDARRYLASIRPAGGTNIHDALLEALRQEPVDSMLPIVLFLTDGLPTIGRSSERAIRQMVEQANVHQRRIFTFGVGGDVNVPLLDRVADITRGSATYVMQDEDVELKVGRVFRRLYGPVLAEPTLQAGDASGRISAGLVSDVLPNELPDLFDGDQLIVLGKYRGHEPITFTIAGNFLGRPRQFEFAFDFDSATTRHAFVPRLWASRRIANLIDQIRQAGATAAGRPRVPGTSPLNDPRFEPLVDEIVRLSTEFGILTEYTAFLAREGTNLSEFNELVAGCSRELDAKAVRKRSGLAAVSQGLNYNWQKAQVALNYGNKFVDERLQRVEIAGVQQMCDRAFFRQEGRWIDSRLVAAGRRFEPDETVMIGSERHFELLRRMVREGRPGVLSLSGKILLDVDGRTILITDGC